MVWRPGRDVERSIPTCVGNTRLASVFGAVMAVHPHVCGEYLMYEGTRYRRSGPSPRVWGIHDDDIHFILMDRSIPTCVGNTHTCDKVPPPLSVHPHVCGEYSLALVGGFRGCGPSPRVWGVLRNNYRKLEKNRSIPTCVGNTVCRHPSPQKPPVHPHVCGEYMSETENE